MTPGTLFPENADLKNEAWFDQKNYVRNIHFKAGDKVHLEDFLFANRMLEVNKNAQVIAQKLAADIIEVYDSLDESEKDYTLTLVGYHLYIETVLSLTVEKLAGSFKTMKYVILNESSKKHNIDDITLPVDTRHMILVMPLGTTLHQVFSFRKKIDRKILNYPESPGPAPKIIDTVINIFLITDGEIGEIEQSPDLSTPNIQYKTFGWHAVDTSKRTVRVFDVDDITDPENPAPITVKYLYYFSSRLHRALTCKLCYPDGEENFYKEEPVLIFDETTLLPNINYWTPSKTKLTKKTGTKFSETSPDAVLTPKCVVSGHSKWNNTCFFHWIDHEKFYNANEPFIGPWMKSIKDNVKELTEGYRDIIIITSGRYHKSEFLASLNRVVFEHKASVIDYNNRENLDENFVDFYQALLKNIDKKIFFYADDIIDNEDNFIELHNFLSHAARKYRELSANRADTKAPVFKFSGVFSMIDRMTDYAEEEFANAKGLVKFYRYHKINVPSLSISQLGCPLCKKKKHYEALVDESMLDFLKLYYEKKKGKLERRDIRDNRSAKGNSFLKKDYFRFINEGAIARSIRDDIKAGNKDYPLTTQIINRELALLNDLSNESFDEKFLQVLITDQLYKIIVSESELDEANYSIPNINVLKQDIINELFPTDAENNFYGYTSEAYTNLMDKIFRIVKASHNISTATSYFSERKNRIVTNKIEKMVIKVLGFPPFALYKTVNIFIFRYSIIELHKHLLDLSTSGEDGKLNIQFDYFLSLKFFMNRIVLLGSNFLLRKETLEHIQKIFDNNDERIDGYTKMYETARLEIPRLKEKLFSDRSYQNFFTVLENNLKYRISRIDSFNYFIVALINDVTFKNHSASIKLEQTLNTFAHVYDIEPENFQDKDFVYLWRLLKLENTFVLSKFIDEITIPLAYKDKERPYDKTLVRLFDGTLNRVRQENGIGLDKIRDALVNEREEAELIDQLVRQSRNNLYQVMEFLDEKNDPAGFEVKKRALYYALVLAYFLRIYIGDKNRQQVLSNKEMLRIIQDLMVKILLPGSTNHNVSFFIDVDPFEKGSVNDVENIYSFVNSERKLTRVSETGIIRKVLNGIWLSQTGASQTFIELVRDKNGKLYSVRKKYYTASRDNSNEKLEEIDFDKLMAQDHKLRFYNKTDNYFLIFRLSDTAKVESGKALFVISANKTDPQFMSPDTLRLLLLIRPLLNAFIDRHYETDSFWERMKEQEDKFRMHSLEHGISRYVNAFGEILARVEDDSTQEDKPKEYLKEKFKEYQFLYTLFRHQMLNYFAHSPTHANDQIDDNVQTTILTLKENIEKWTGYIFKDYLIGGDALTENDYDLKVETGLKDDDKVTLSSAIINQVIPEIIVNIKKRNQFGIDDISAAVIHWHISLIRLDEKPFLHICVKNTVSNEAHNYFKEIMGDIEIKDKKGLGMCKNLLKGGTLDADYIPGNGELNGRPHFYTDLKCKVILVDKKD